MGGAFSSSRTSLVSASSLISTCVCESLHPLVAGATVSEYLDPIRRAEKLLSASSMTYIPATNALRISLSPNT